MQRFLAVLVFAAAASSAALAGSGMVVAPHVDTPGTPARHDHAAKLLRFPIALATSAAPFAADQALATYRYPIYLLRMQDRFGSGPRFAGGWSLTAELGALVLALLVMLTPRLATPVRLRLADVPPPLARAAQWRPAVPILPPRADALLSA